tara:strand:+ start:6802 stop:8148 length:1347 start_codon:yes stop_codon:yes gene_type:complete
MVATLTTLNAALKQHYVAPIVTQLNEEIDILNEFTKQSVSWSGSEAIFPVKTTRNSGVDYIPDGGNLPTATNVGTERFVVTAQSLVARFQITNKSLKAAKKGGAGAFIGALELEMDGAMEAAKNRCNRTATSGGRLVGFIHEKKLSTNAGESGANTYIVRGDVTKIAAMLVHAPTLELDFIPYSEQTGVGTYVAPAAYHPMNGTDSIICTAADPVAGTITVAAQDSGANNVTTLAVTLGFGIGVHIKDTTVAVSDILDREPVGLYGNIGLQTLHGLNRSQVSGTASTQTLQSSVLTQRGLVTDALDTISLDRIQQVFDRTLNLAGEEGDQIWLSPLFRNQYTSLFSGAADLIVDSNKTSKRADGGFNAMSYAGIPMKTSRHVDNGLLLFIKRKHWKVAELAPIGFADEDGRIINKVQGSARIEGFLEWDYNLVCTRPNAQAILCGLTV